MGIAQSTMDQNINNHNKHNNKANSKTFNLLSLPKVIRERVYSFMIEDSSSAPHYPLVHLKAPNHPSSTPENLVPYDFRNVAFTCRLLRSEYLPLWRATTNHSVWHENFDSYLCTFLPEPNSVIRHYKLSPLLQAPITMAVTILYRTTFSIGLYGQRDIALILTGHNGQHKVHLYTCDDLVSVPLPPKITICPKLDALFATTPSSSPGAYFAQFAPRLYIISLSVQCLKFCDYELKEFRLGCTWEKRGVKEAEEDEEGKKKPGMEADEKEEMGEANTEDEEGKEDENTSMKEHGKEAYEKEADGEMPTEGEIEIALNLTRENNELYIENNHISILWKGDQDIATTLWQ
ncbi:hypothetical protein B0J11DRAFT_505312 [Dendryphion nanum]|uniref:F-box protein n=1 Tax=Dendryphion nanum TaxID=256645 RepID=A0A9P9DX24_9PLEO|nr:hypothetical protein B0J11DRAFT_505312 [Dendryphion nanum]